MPIITDPAALNGMIDDPVTEPTLHHIIYSGDGWEAWLLSYLQNDTVICVQIDEPKYDLPEPDDCRFYNEDGIAIGEGDKSITERVWFLLRHN